MFLGRASELATLAERFESPKFEFGVIFGRRRIGKTTLIKEFCKDKRHIYFAASETTAQLNLQRLSQAVNDALNPGSRAPFASIDDVFAEVNEAAKREPLIFVIDEYPFLAESVEGMNSILQIAVDHLFIDNSNLFLILSGSSISFMEQQVLSYHSPLYARRTFQQRLRPFSIQEAREMLPSFNNEDLLTVYGLTGGIPLYLATMDDQVSLKQNIMRNFFNSNALLYEEPLNLLHQEFRAPARYNAILEAIAQGASQLNEIVTKTGIEKAVLMKYLANLMEVHIVEKMQPLTEKNSRKAIYKITDGIFRFWYRYIPKLDYLLEIGKSKEAYQILEADFPQFNSFTFEDVCKQWIGQVNGSEEFGILLTKLGSWWGNNPLVREKQAEEIDILGFDYEEKTVFVGECKWRNELTDVSVLEKLVMRSQFFPQMNKELAVFLKSGYTQGAQEFAREHDIRLYLFSEMV